MLFQNKCLPFAGVLIAVLFIISCKNGGQKSPEGYALDKPKRSELGKVLNEISGITYSAEDSSILAVSDSKEKVFQINLRNRKLADYTEKVIDSNSDVEDIVKVDTSLFLLMSKGTLVEVPQKAKDTSSIKTYDLGLQGSNDFETIYLDHSLNSLVLLCKTCAHEQGSGVRTAFRFDLRSRSFISNAFFTISRGQVKDLLKNQDADFKPSAAAINPVSKRLFVLSSAGNLLVVCDNRGQAIEAYDLHPDVYPQAEGIAFAPNGDMYIANEGKNGKPTLLYFPYQQHGKKK